MRSPSVHAQCSPVKTVRRGSLCSVTRPGSFKCPPSLENTIGDEVLLGGFTRGFSVTTGVKCCVLIVIPLTLKCSPSIYHGFARHGAQHDRGPFSMGQQPRWPPRDGLTAWQAAGCLVRSSPPSEQLLLSEFGGTRGSGIGAGCIRYPGPSFRRGQFFKLVPLSGNLMSTALRHALPSLGSGRF